MNYKLKVFICAHLKTSASFNFQQYMYSCYDFMGVKFSSSKLFIKSLRGLDARRGWKSLPSSTKTF